MSEQLYMNWEASEIVEQESDKFKRWIKESICIRSNTPTMNRDDRAYQLSPIWTQVISTPNKDDWQSSKTTVITLLGHHTFLYISLPSLDDYGVNCQISRFIDNGNIRRQISLSLSKLEFTPGKCAYIGQSERVGIIALKFQRTRSQFFSEVFAAEPVVVS